MTAPRGCVTADEATALLDGRLADDDAAAIDAHVGDCDACRRVIAALAGSGDGTGATVAGHRPAGVTPGTRVGRYELREPLGRGGMGVVYRARDATLGRDVAVKLIDVATPAAAVRALREARALAALAHPNVVAIHDAGEHDGGVYLTMELVAGRSLSAWLAEAPRATADVLAVIADAARGLAAAHRAGLVHRDVKPSNILVGDDGRTRIADFGLARDADAAAATTAPPAREPLGAAVTATRHLVGTPAYMAPEQLRGEPADARTDQFALAQTTWEALAGAPPFAATRVDERLAAIAAGPRLPTGDARGGIPAHVERALRRALAVDPAARFVSVEAFAAALLPPRRRGRLAAAAVAIGLAGGAAAFTLAAGDDAQPADPCARPADLAGTWDPARRAALRAALVESGAAYGADVADRLARVVDDWADGWRDASIATCRAGRRDRADGALRAGCLASRRAALDALLGAVVAGGRDTLDGALQAAQDLPGAGACADPASPAAALASGALHDALAAIELRFALKDPTLAPAEVTTLAGRARDAGEPAIAARALLHAGLVHLSRDAPAEAEAALREAAPEAARARDDRTAARIWIALGETQLVRSKIDELRALLPVAEVAVERAGNPDDVRADLLSLRARLETDYGDRVSALAALEQVVALRERSAGATSWRLAMALGNLGVVYSAADRHDDGRAASDRALAIVEALGGPLHPSVFTLLQARVWIETNADAAARARPYLERSRAIIDHTGIGERVAVASFWQSYGDLELDAGNHALALEHYARARALREPRLGAHHPYVLEVDMKIVVARHARGDPPAEVAAAARRVRDAFRAAAAEPAAAWVDAWLAEHGLTRK
jgi:tetratricopeptide (TPR) repeat protein